MQVVLKQSKSNPCSKCKSSTILFLTPFKMIEYNQKQSKEIYKALADSKVDLMEYFLGADPKKTDYYKNAVRKRSLLNDF